MGSRLTEAEARAIPPLLELPPEVLRMVLDELPRRDAAVLLRVHSALLAAAWPAVWAHHGGPDAPVPRGAVSSVTYRGGHVTDLAPLLEFCGTHLRMLDVGDCELGRVALGTVLALVRPDLDELAMPLSPARAAAGVEPDAGEVGVALTRFRSLRRLNVAGRMLSALEMAANRGFLRMLASLHVRWWASLSTVRFASCYDVGIVGLLPAALVSLELIVPIDADRMEGLCTLLRQVAELPALEAMILGDSLKNGLFQPGKLFFGQIRDLLKKERRGASIRSRGFKMEWLQGIIEAMPKLSRFLCIDPAVTTKAKDRLIRAKKELDDRSIRYNIDTNLGTGRFEAWERQGLRVLASDHLIRVRLVETGSRR
ncbi:hypothetical protein DFJ74DRAFT_704736 [Hyaloraphidium curvatum]|nr:hypothetical protein DFJ74DRAFT_766605 [Hyaloraphidium curvatum]KAI9026249.1 hypothetical protein DFJ74DRAFT_704736 [Hyaloraphidium curvatum]